MDFNRDEQDRYPPGTLDRGLQAVNEVRRELLGKLTKDAPQLREKYGIPDGIVHSSIAMSALKLAIVDIAHMALDLEDDQAKQMARDISKVIKNYTAAALLGDETEGE